MKFFKSLHFQVFASIIIGIVFGYLYPTLGTEMKPLGDAFIKLIKMIIGPIIFCTIVCGIAGMGDMKKVGRVGGKALLYFEAVTTFSLFFGILLVEVLKPGQGMNIDPSTLDASSVAAYAQAAQTHTVGQFFMNIIPNTVIDAFAKGEILQILLFSIIFGWALSKMGEKGRPLLQIINDVSQTFFKIVDIIMKLAPVGTFGAMAFTIGAYGIGSLSNLLKLLGTFYLACFLFLMIIIGPIAKWAGINFFHYLNYFKEELLVVFGTASSESVLPRMMEKLEKLGCSKSIVGLVIPTGYSFNLDGTSIYLTIAAIFLAQATNTDLTFTQEATIIAVLLLTSKGASGVTGSGFIVLAATLSSMPSIPVGALALIFGVDRFMTQGRALTNLVGNGIATFVVARWENELDYDKMQVIASNGKRSTKHELV
ncbi:dicarboxylate/amino acid:cation symporter [Pectinatus frisingensis]|jgi:aerobic C4-dicarboxylate transport protein|uniref:dicarboxylate/amino acid:cation symporter n=1 Tax=Pectinatus frisingensis TaxID=865 RepID=UPI0015F64DA1|nr:dicarboxylate/amino acid:cation symporter [Pectinatus frisingensis]